MIVFLVLVGLIIAIIEWLPPNAMRDGGFIPGGNAAWLQSQQRVKSVVGILLLLPSIVVVVAGVSDLRCFLQSVEGRTPRVLNSGEARHELFVQIMWTGIVMAASLLAVILIWLLKRTHPFLFRLPFIIVQVAALRYYLYVLLRCLKSITVSVGFMKITAFPGTFPVILVAAFALALCVNAVFMLACFLARRFTRVA